MSIAASRSPNHPRGRAHRVGAGAVGVTLMAALGVLALAHVASTARSWLLFDDGDSVVLALVRRAAESGQELDWVWSPVLFVPEGALYGVLSAFGLSPQATLALNAIVNVVVFGLCGRFALGPALHGQRLAARIGSGVLVSTALVVFVMCESTDSRTSLELASLQLLTTYYSGTVWGMLLAVGLTVRIRAAGPGRTRTCWGVLLALVCAGSVSTNPLLIAWACVPIAAVVVLTGFAGVRHRRRAPLEQSPVTVRRWSPPDAWVLGAIGAGTAIGLVSRWDVRTPGTHKIRPDAMGRSVEFTLGAVAERLQTPAGMLEVLIWVALWSVVVWLAVRSWRRSDRRSAVTFTFVLGATGPVVVMVGSVLLGTSATRYLQPVLLLPLVCVPLAVAACRRAGKATACRRLQEIRRRRALRWVTASVVVVLGSAAAAVPGAASAATTVNRSVDCVVAWADEVARPGAGDFWDIRGVKYRLRDPEQLIQVDGNQRMRPWLANRRDGDGVRAVSWMVFGPDGPGWEPGRVASVDRRVEPRVLRCGTFAIVDWGRPVVPVVRP